MKNSEKLNNEGEVSITSDFEIESIPNTDFLIGHLRFFGEYKIGGLGNKDSDYICNKIVNVLSDHQVQGVLINFTEMSYQWGNRIFNALILIERASKPSAIVYSEKNLNMVSPDDPLYFKKSEEALENLKARIILKLNGGL